MQESVGAWSCSSISQGFKNPNITPIPLPPLHTHTPKKCKENLPLHYWVSDQKFYQSSNEYLCWNWGLLSLKDEFQQKLMCKAQREWKWCENDFLFTLKLLCTNKHQRIKSCVRISFIYYWTDFARRDACIHRLYFNV